MQVFQANVVHSNPELEAGAAGIVATAVNCQQQATAAVGQSPVPEEASRPELVN